MLRGGGCAIRPALTQKWAAATYLAIGTTKKELRGCVILCIPGDK